MDCLKAQQLAEDCAKGRLPERLCCDVRDHLNDCTDCRVAVQRAAKLQRLLALKRHEQPCPSYFEKFLSEFHRRQQAGERLPMSWTERFVEWATAKPVDAWAYQFAGAAAVAVAFGILWTSIQPTDQPAVPVNREATLGSPTTMSASLPAMTDVSPTPDPKSSTVVMASEEDNWSSDGNSINAAAARAAGGSNTRYVLDRFEITPVSYDDRGIHF